MKSRRAIQCVVISKERPEPVRFPSWVLVVVEIRNRKLPYLNKAIIKNGMHIDQEVNKKHLRRGPIAVTFRYRYLPM
jgi:hypothetical protein